MHALSSILCSTDDCRIGKEKTCDSIKDWLADNPRPLYTISYAIILRQQQKLPTTSPKHQWFRRGGRGGGKHYSAVKGYFKLKAVEKPLFHKI